LKGNLIFQQEGGEITAADVGKWKVQWLLELNLMDQI
jgi:hypothetical protein